METLVVNFSGTVRQADFLGREYLVAPVTLIVPGVLNGSQGPLYYPPEEVTRYPEIWNHVPILLNHPEPGQTATDIAVLSRSRLGFLLNAKADGKLTAEAWFDILRTMEIDKRVIDNIRAGKPTEVSTGLRIDQEQVENGDYNGVAYTAVARNYRPDHLAVLLDSVGACSLNDGCGVLNKDLSHEMVRDRLYAKLQSQFTQDEPRCWIVDVFDDFLVYEKGEKLWKLSYTKSADDVTLGGNPTEVRRETTFKPVANETNPSQGETAMALNATEKKSAVDYLVTNCECWKEADRETLNGFTDEKITQLVDHAKKEKNRAEVVNAVRDGFGTIFNSTEEVAENEMPAFIKKAIAKKKAKAKKGGKKDDEEDDDEEDDKPAKNQSFQEWYDAAPSEVQNTFKYARDIENRERKELIDRITANVDEADKSRVTNRLKDKSIDELRDLAILAPPKPEVQNDYHLPNYMGQAAPAGRPAFNADEDLLIPMAMNYGADG